jgi:hypothetical protein
MLARLRPYIFLFVALTVVYHANLRPVDSSDSLPASLIPLAVVLDHTVTLDRFVPWLRAHVEYEPTVIQQAHGHYFSHYPIGGPLLVSPLYLPLAFIGRFRDWDSGSLVMFARIAEKFAATTIAALSAVVLLLLLKRITTATWAWRLTLVYALATETWSISSQALWQHGPGELAIIGCLFCLERWLEDRARNGWLWLAGTCAAAAFIIRPTNIVLLPALLAALSLTEAALEQHIRVLARVFAVPLCGGLLLASYNLYVFQRASGGYRSDELTGSMLRGLAGLFISPGRGLLIYTPIALFAVCAFLPRAAFFAPDDARREHSPLVAAAAVFIVLDCLVISGWRVWWGGYCWGPRLLTELVPPLIVLMAVGVPWIEHSRLRAWPRRAFTVLALYSVLIQAIGVFFYPKGRWDEAPQLVDKAPARVWNWRDNPIKRTILGGPTWEPYAIVGAALTGGIPAAQRRMRELNFSPYDESAPAGVSSDGRGLP